MRKRTGIAVVLALCCGVGFAACAEEEQTRADFLAAEAAEGWVRLGEFGKHWPARVVSEEQAFDEIEVTLASGTRHRYPGYTGYELKLVRLEDAEGRETALVMRSREKR